MSMLRSGAERAERDPQCERGRLAVHERRLEPRLGAHAQERAGAEARAQLSLGGDAVAHHPADVEQPWKARRGQHLPALPSSRPPAGVDDAHRLADPHVAALGDGALDQDAVAGGLDLVARTTAESWP
jgi:hypothetical protein